MSRNILVGSLAFAAICASSVLVSAQITSSPTEVNDSVQSGSAAVAYVYVSRTLTNGTNKIRGYKVASNGSLTAITGSPFAANVSFMAVNGQWLFGIEVNPNASIIDSYSIASNGSLTLAGTYTAENSAGVVNVFLDHTGGSLYTDYYTTNNDYLAYSINQSTGQLTFLNDLGGGPAVGSVVSFIGSNQFAYSSSCYHFGPSVFGVERNSDGSLAWLNTIPPLPTAKSGDFYCPWSAAADPTNHLAVAVQPYTFDWVQDGSVQLATYTADSAGNLTTNSTHSNMPSVLVGNVNQYSMSPSGKYLAVGGSSGLQIFHFNGANPITKFTGLLASDQIDQLFWDNANHLYAISRTANKLFVFTVTSSGASPAPGSPHSITNPNNIIVLPKI